jgi:hypothetical protein
MKGLSDGTVAKDVEDNPTEQPVEHANDGHDDDHKDENNIW